MLKLQRVQNSLARAVTYTKRVEHSRPVLYRLHWLPINYRINYKVATLAYKVRSTGSPAFLLPSVSDCSNQKSTVFIAISAQRACRQNADS